MENTRPAPRQPLPWPRVAIDAFLLLLRAHGLPLPEVEVRFHPTRRWRADYLWREALVIVEREGGLFSRNLQAQRAHGAPVHILRDMEKSNAAQLLGYVYLRYTPTQLDSGAALDDVTRVLSRAGGGGHDVAG
jgi:hypothetical protein